MRRLILCLLMLTTVGQAQLSPEQREESSDEIRDQIRREYGEPTALDPHSFVSTIFYRIVEVTERRDIQYRVSVVQEDDTVNAYALPDGQVVFLTGLLNRLPSGDEDAVAFVAAHEIAHLERDHLGRLARNAGMTSLLLGLLTQGSQEWLQLLANVTNNVLVSGYSRGMEAEADRRGMELMARAGYDPRGALTTLELFQQIAARSPGLDIFPTHPHPADRYRDALAYIKSQGLAVNEERPASPRQSQPRDGALARRVHDYARQAAPSGVGDPQAARAALQRVLELWNEPGSPAFREAVRAWQAGRDSLSFPPEQWVEVLQLDLQLES
ncbi:MAG: hypothetical protein AMXMBFR33_46500 [Candidatus Xenobia bacterium]